MSKKQNLAPSDIERLMATHVTVCAPDGKPVFAEGDGVMPIVLDTGDHVWVASSYAYDLDAYPQIKQVGDGRDNAYDWHGNCVHSVPAEWCTFLSETDARACEQAYCADQRLLSYAR